VGKYILILFLFPCIWAKAQQEVITLEISKSSVKVNEAFNVVVKSTMEGDISIQFPDELSTGYAVMNGMEQAYDRASGEIKSIHYYNQEGYFTKSGTFTIGPAIIKRGRTVLKSNKVTIEVALYKKTNPEKTTLDLSSDQPAFGRLISNKKSVFIGESFALRAKVYSKFPPMSVEDYSSYLDEENLSHHPLDKNTFLSASKENMEGVSLYSFEHDRNLVFPIHPGKLKINPFKLVLRQGFDEVAVISDKCSIEVKPLPSGAPPSFIGFVGHLKAEAKTSGTCKFKGDILKFELVLTGKGNLHHIEAPTIHLPAGLELYESPKLTEDYVFTEEGADGKVIVNYTLVASDSINNILEDQAISYFDLAQGKYVTLNISANQNNSNSISSIDPLKAEEGTTIINRRKNASNTSNGFSFLYPQVLWSGAGFLALGIIWMGIVFQRKRRKKDALDNPTVGNPPLNLSWSALHNRINTSLISDEITQLEQILLDSLALKLQLSHNHRNTINDFQNHYPFLHSEVAALINTIKEVRYGMNLLQETHISLIEKTRKMVQTIEQY
jgi:hypothetical protein